MKNREMAQELVEIFNTERTDLTNIWNTEEIQGFIADYSEMLESPDGRDALIISLKNEVKDSCSNKWIEKCINMIIRIIQLRK